MTVEEWELRLDAVEEDLECAQQSKSRTKVLDCEALSNYVAWIKMKRFKAMTGEQR